MQLTVAALLVMLASGATQGPVAAHPSLPWLANADDVRAVDAGDRAVTLPMDLIAEVDASCAAAAYPGLVLDAELDAAAGVERVVASFAHGVMVLSAEGQLVASTPGFACQGSADELDVLAAGRAFGAPVVFVVLTTGGRREQTTWLGMFRVGLHHRLEPTFAGVVEQWEDGIVRRGRVVLLPGALIYHQPDGDTSFWVIDDVAGIYLPTGSIRGNGAAHAEVSSLIFRNPSR